MLYGNQSISYYSPSNILIWMAMATQAGLLNIGGYMAGHQLVSHVTGFVTFFGASLGEANFTHSLMLLIIPLFFLLGAMVSGYFVDVRLRKGKKPKYYITFGIMFFFLLLVFILGVGHYFGDFGEWSSPRRSYALLIILCFVCGIQNATISVVSKSVIRTTHLTGITTDLGLGIMRLLNRKKLGDSVLGEKQANLMRIAIIVSFILGSALGGFVFGHFAFYGFIFPLLISGMLFSLMLYFQLIRRA